MFLCALLASVAPLAVDAQTAAPFPSKTITLVVPFTAGSGSDIIARIIQNKLQSRWGRPVIVDNKPGATGNLGANAVAKAAPDGHTLLMMLNAFTMTPSLYRNLPFDPIADFAPVAKLAEASYAFAVSAGISEKDVKSLIAYSKKNPGKLTYASPGNGSPQHLGMELLKQDVGLDARHIPYKGIAGATTDLVGGHVDMMFGTLHSMLPQVQAGKVHLIAVTGQSRNPLAPEVPTFKEQGIDSMDTGDAWYGVMAPAQTSSELVVRLNRDFVEVMNTDEVKTALAKQGLSVRTSSPAQLASLVKSEIARWKKVVTVAGITAD
ncbi:MAG: tripartite tricarboxylate transporter substrate binding protein [Pseudomonadota bacterium]|nr:tripartite tricarboxylate transporter substrate binding protein [Pseudomonadota bacterium]